MMRRRHTTALLCLLLFTLAQWAAAAPPRPRTTVVYSKRGEENEEEWKDDEAPIGKSPCRDEFEPAAEEDEASEEDSDGYDASEDEEDEDNLAGNGAFEDTELYGGRKSLGKQSKVGVGMLKGVGQLTGRTMKGMVHLLQPKAVALPEILTAWKLEQQLGRPPGRVQRSAATVGFRRDGTVAVHYDGVEMLTEFKFYPRRWPRACSIEFDARAWQGPRDGAPVLKHYRGEFVRNLMDPRVITIEGVIYDVRGNALWKKRIKSGTFVAKRRPLSSSQSGGAERGGRSGGSDGREGRSRSGGGGGKAAIAKGSKQPPRRPPSEEEEDEEEEG